MSHFNNLLYELYRFIDTVVRITEERKPATIMLGKKRIVFGGTLNISFNLSAKVGLDEVLQNRERLSYTFASEIEPLIDLFDDGENLKMVVLLPGIKKEDVKLDVKEGSLGILIRKGSQIYHREIPCNIAHSKLSVRSVKNNNSVLEILIGKQKG